MSIVAISQTYGSLGDAIGTEVARALGYRFADREIILQAAERSGRTMRELEHMTEERPTLWERLSDTKRRYLAYVETVLFDLAAEGDVVLAGRGAPFSLRGVTHALRVRISAREAVRAERLGLGLEAGLDLVRHSDRERASRVRFLYHADWDDPLLYDLVVNTEHFDVPGAVRVILEALGHERFRPTPESLAHVGDLSLGARARTALLTDTRTEDLDVSVTCRGGILSLTGRVSWDEQRALAEETVRHVAGAGKVLNEIIVLPPLRRGV
jgi:cytidylate kinase